ncbi:MAG TPA: hypothetical protein VFO38_00255 [Candidatus Saccharimonadales bacterium]|nr:hypothetical protein [Candidatus Saccharimonadales bacterium]
MSEHFPYREDPFEAKPLDYAGETSSEDLSDIDPPTPESRPGDAIERDGRTYVLVPELRWSERWEDGKRIPFQTPYTYKQYYAHTYEEPETGRRIPGPGWDAKFRLYDDKIAILLHNRTFTKGELENIPANLPDEECLFVSEPDGGRAAEYEEYLEKSTTQ